MEIKHLQDRLKVLREEHIRCEEQLRQLDERRSELHHTSLRIAGAIQVLEEVESEMTSQQGKL